MRHIITCVNAVECSGVTTTLFQVSGASNVFKLIANGRGGTGDLKRDC